MQITIARIEHISKDHLLSTLKRTRLKGHNQVEIYETAAVERLLAVDPDALMPAQNYVLMPTVRDILALRSALQSFDSDIFALDGGLWFWLEKEEREASASLDGDAIPILPPIVEESREPDGRTVWLINDGIHRVYAAKKSAEKINIVLARNVPARYPYYAYALPQGWPDVVELEDLRDGFQKKTYRDPANYKALFRDFNAVFAGVQKQRKRTNPPELKP